MDSLTQIALGATVAGLAAPRAHRRRALLLGAALGTAPDLDVFIDFGGPVENFTRHRGFSHSLVVLTPLAIGLWLALHRFWAAVREAPRRWLAAIALALLTHPLLDAHTAYGTQLFWPLPVPPVKWGTLFIIDPLFTLPLLAGVIAASAWPGGLRAERVLRTGLVVSVLYLGWSWVGKTTVTRQVDAYAKSAGLAGQPHFVTPTPFNTLLWRVVLLTDDGYLEGFDSLLLRGDLAFTAYPSDREALAENRNLDAVERLDWFSGGLLRAEVADDRLVLSDLRMGQEPSYAFNFAVAERGNPHWRPIAVEQIPISIGDRALAEVWARIWREPAPTR
jgi:inner membrane protein